jgi:hypothetical protein
MTIRPVVAAALATVALTAAPTSHPAALGTAMFDTGGCASRAEVDQLDTGMSTGTVREIFDIPGHYGPDTDDQFSLEFKSCWAPGERSVRVWFDLVDGLSRRWLVVDA